MDMVIRVESGQSATVVLVMVISLMCFVGTAAQLEVFSSISAVTWWSVVNLTTVGYGDIVPVTGVGCVLAAVIAVLGIGLFALSAGILSAAIVEANELGRADELVIAFCPYCLEGLP